MNCIISSRRTRQCRWCQCCYTLCATCVDEIWHSLKILRPVVCFFSLVLIGLKRWRARDERLNFTENETKRLRPFFNSMMMIRMVDFFSSKIRLPPLWCIFPILLREKNICDVRSRSHIGWNLIKITLATFISFLVRLSFFSFWRAMNKSMTDSRERITSCSSRIHLRFRRQCCCCAGWMSSDRRAQAGSFVRDCLRNDLIGLISPKLSSSIVRRERTT